jgi:exonuclease SbcC
MPGSTVIPALAGRGGGRLDALFLDEGFGSLDANSLSEALDVPGRQAETGRMVAVISHLRSVAEAMDRVLAVTDGPSGSQIRWLGGDEPDDMITEDIEASLLSRKMEFSWARGSGRLRSSRLKGGGVG